MNENLLTFIYYGAGWLISMSTLVFAINFFSKGFLFAFLKVKGSRGKKILGRIFTKVDTYWVAINQDKDKGIVYIDRTKQKRALTNVTTNCIYHSMNIPCLDIDEDSGTIFTRANTLQIACDTVKTDLLIERALQKPNLDNVKYFLFIIILVILVVILSGISLYYGFVNNENILLLFEKLGTPVVIQ